MRLLIVFINWIRTGLEIGLSTLLNRVFQFQPFIQKLNEGYSNFFQAHSTLHWLFFGLGVLLFFHASSTGNVRAMIANGVITAFACPLAPFNKIPGLIRYLTIGLLTLEQLLDSL